MHHDNALKTETVEKPAPEKKKKVVKETPKKDVAVEEPEYPDELISIQNQKTFLSKTNCRGLNCLEVISLCDQLSTTLKVK